MRLRSSFLNNRAALSCLAAALLLMICSLDSLAQADLTGVWSCDDGGLYYIRQLGETIWWYGEQSSPNPAFSNVATGTIDGNTINLNWSDVPKGGTTSSGTLVLNIESSDKLTAIQKTGGFGGSVWTRTATSPAVSPAEPSPTTSVPVSPGMGASIPTMPGTNATGPNTSPLTTLLGLNASDPTIIEMF